MSLLLIVLLVLGVIILPAFVIPHFFVRRALREEILPWLKQKGYQMTGYQTISTFGKEHLPSGEPFSPVRFVYVKLDLRKNDASTEPVTVRISTLFWFIKDVKFERKLD